MPAPTHDRGLLTPDGKLECDCGEICADKKTWHRHTALTYNSPRPLAIEARGGVIHRFIKKIDPNSPGDIVHCPRVGCHNAANDRGCWWIIRPGLEPLYAFPTRHAAEQLLERGGIISATYTMSVC